MATIDVTGPTWMSPSSRIASVAPKRQRMISASEILMCGFLYGLRRQTIERHSQTSRQWMNYRNGERERKKGGKDTIDRSILLRRVKTSLYIKDYRIRRIISCTPSSRMEILC